MAMRLVASGSTLVLNILLARQLGPDYYGQVAFVMAWLLLVVGLMRTGLNNQLTREVASYDERNERANLRGIIIRAYQFAVIATIGAGASIAGAAIVLDSRLSPGQSRLFLIGLPLLLFLSLMSTTEAITKGFGKTVSGQLGEFFVRPISHLLFVVLLWLPIGFDLNRQSAVGAFVLSGLCGFAVAWMVRPRGPLQALRQAEPQFHDRQWLRDSVAISAVGWLSIVNVQATPILVGVIGGDAEVAHYQIASQFAFLASLMVVILNTLQAPTMSRAHAIGDVVRLQRMASHACEISVVFAFGSAIFFALFGELIATTLLGKSYNGVETVLFVILIGTSINALTGSVGILLIACRLENTMYLALGLALATNISGCILLVPKYGAIGGAWSATASLACWNGCMLLRLYRATGVLSLPLVTRLLPSSRPQPLP
ncbi:oligosaccharide flippase family protein [Rhizorhabdus wittichii]|uniref:oligosaccharide flippase family protein n=1 Tax=Rhizorhabdus wittichii TaxID=160791 RepID=UPI000568CAEA|nr:oligosaccharide flippase family protein [Rhizorhabdus wittichii]